MQKTFSDYEIRAAIAGSGVGFLADADTDDKVLLERHFNDLYAVFLHKLSSFALQPTASKEEVERLRAFFDGLLKARQTLEK